jgi:sulfite exporter TauE/SafE
MASAISLAGGAALGLASSLHCIGMCGGIAVLFGYSPGGCGAAAAGREQALLHGGRIASYALLGAAAGSLGSAALGGIEAGSGQALLRWAAAVSLGWMGLVTAGIAPAPALLVHGAGTGRWRMRLMLHLPPPARRMAGGVLWGLLPCGMVYGALLYAMFAGTALGGALVMLGFGACRPRFPVDADGLAHARRRAIAWGRDDRNRISEFAGKPRRAERMVRAHCGAILNKKAAPDRFRRGLSQGLRPPC